MPFDRDYLGEPVITHVSLANGVVPGTLKCKVPFNRDIRSWKNVTYVITWYSEGSHLKTHLVCGKLRDGETEYDNSCPGQPLSSELEGAEYQVNRFVSKLGNLNLIILASSTLYVILTSYI